MSEVAEYISIDSIPELAEPRQTIRDEAWALIEDRKNQKILDGNEQGIPLAIDALSTADRVIESRDMFGSGSKEYDEKLEGLKLDCSRLVAEWYRKKRPEYFPPTRHYFDDETEDFYSHGMSIRQMTENALRPIEGSPEEEARRVNEKVEDETPRILRKLGSFALQGSGIRTISECTDKAIEDYAHDQRNGIAHRGYDGYVPEIEKVMIRDMHIDELSGDRVQEQLGLPGIFINHFVMKKTLEKKGINSAGLDKTSLHGNQILVKDDLMDFAKALDEEAGNEWRINVFMGEQVPNDFVKDYDNFRNEALDRQESLRDLSDTVATFVLDLADDGFDRRKAPGHVEDFVKKLLLEAARKDLGVAEQIFDKKTETGLREVNNLYDQGRYEEAHSLMNDIEKMAPGGGFCSGGSCGLESVDVNSELGKSLWERLKATSGDTIVMDKERACRCGAKSIVYAYSKNKVNKLCTSCDAFESKITK